MKEIELSQGKFAIVDDDDYFELSKTKWCINSTSGYAIRRETRNGKSVFILMHRQIKTPPLGMFIDHINGDKLDNQKSNLRFCTKSQNAANTKKQSNNTSGYKGVYRDKNNKKNPFAAYIKKHGVRRHLGYFLTAEIAASVYDAAAREFFGEFARTNFGEGK